MNSINERVKKLRSILKLSRQEFSKQISISHSSLGEIETGVRNVNDRIIQLISSQFKVEKEWLKFGNGEIFEIEKPDIRIDHLIEIYKQLDKPLQDYLMQQSELILKLHNENNITKK